MAEQLVAACLPTSMCGSPMAMMVIVKDEQGNIVEEWTV